MRKLIETFVRYPFYANLFIVVIVISGVYGFLELKKSFFPQRESRNIYVTVSYPGASPKEMEEGITVRIEQAIRGLVGIKEINSNSRENFARVSIETTGEYDIDEVLQEVKNAVDGISSMPVDAERPIVYKQRSTTPAIRLGLYGSADLMRLKTLAQRIEDDFLQSGLMSQISIGGFPALEIAVEIEEEVLLRHGLTHTDISNAISRNNRDVSGGELRSDEQYLIIRYRSRTVHPDEIANYVVMADPNGKTIRISDLGKVFLQFSETPSGAWLNGERALYLSVNKLITEDLEAISNYVNQYADEFNEKHADAELIVTFDFLDLLNSRLHLLYRNGGMGLLLVVIILAFFLSFRLSLWVAWGIPSSFLGMFVLASMYGVTINMISLFGMILVIGILVDDGIVVAENIFSHFEKGKSPRRAAVDGTLEVLPAVITSVTTTIIAFVPLMLIQGNMEMMGEMAFVVVFSLAFSLIEASLVLPAHIGSPHILQRRNDAVNFGNRFRNRLERYIFWMRDRFYGRILAFILRHRHIALVVPLVLILITAGLFGGGFISSTFFPNIPPDSFNVNVAFTPGEGEKQTHDYLSRFEKTVWEVNEQLMEEHKDTANFVDYTYLVMGSSFDGLENGTHAGHISVSLRNLEGSDISAFDIATRVREAIGRVPAADKFSVAGRNRWGKPISISLMGENLEELDQARDFLLSALEDIPELTDIVDNEAPGAQEVRLELKPKAHYLGLDMYVIMNQVRNAFFGAQSQRLQQGKDEIRVWVRYPPDDREHIGQLETMKIKTPQGEFPLSELVTYTLERGPVAIARFNGKREMRIDADLVDPYEPVPDILEEVSNTIMPQLQAQYPGVTYLYQGQQKSAAESQNEIAKYFIPAFGLIMIIIMFHFRSFGQGAIVLMMVPLGWIGAVWGHGLHGIPLSMLSVWGMVAVSGVIVNDAVVFLQKYNQFLEESYSVADAAFKAGLARFRPIVLTTLTTTLGLYPIILETSRQAQFLIPMAMALAYGILFGTGFILLFFPVVIMALNDVRLLLKWLVKGKRPSREEVETVNVFKNRTID
ncbi:efflux RND transporter permease subunit [Geofilum rubicundum]|uniref:Acriflavin resistance protein n=1 Tax=Geofilum rubicundum JCM 15548 TaxID=1236989 RepID=A0A0E9LYY8_9BACT|nr:efflux RND transporter permease subunit [Geofilum rubicundum]GAO30503.1 acriflavin resistance protein [Geofilum rubicundum JCM 15548]